MIEVKLTTCAPYWPWSRQTVGGRLEWGPFRFHVDTDIAVCDAWVVFESLSKSEEVTMCPPENILFIAGEPDSIGAYHHKFLQQFHHVINCRSDINHARQFKIQQGHPWFVEKSFDELVAMPPIVKTRDICVISSDKAFTEGHRKRVEFVQTLKDRLGDRIDVWGRGIRDFEQKWDVLAPYRYAIVLENLDAPDWLTEKMPDALLAYCFPIYHGCSNVHRYFNDEAYLRININDVESSLSAIETLLADPNDYGRRIAGVGRARLHYLHHLQFFANISNILQICISVERPSYKVSLNSNRQFVEAQKFNSLINIEAGNSLESHSVGQKFARVLNSVRSRLSNK